MDLNGWLLLKKCQEGNKNDNLGPKTVSKIDSMGPYVKLSEECKRSKKKRN